MSEGLNKYSIAIHGGSGTVTKSSMTPWKERAYMEALHRALLAGSNVLDKGGKAIDAVVESVKTMEDSPLFNAGRGSVFNQKGEHEMDAAIMNGKNLQAGAVLNVRQIKNPIILARTIMQKSKHIMLSGEGAHEFAREQAIEFRPKEYFYDEFRYKQWQKAVSKGKITLDHDAVEEHKYGTVGAVARDRKGNLAAATSTGGIVNKKYGRIGDSPIIGAGTYANNQTCAVSCTGFGEYFIRLVVAHELSALMKHRNMGLHEASELLIQHSVKELGGRGGLIAIDQRGNICATFNTKGMYRAYKKEGQEAFVDIYGTQSAE